MYKRIFLMSLLSATVALAELAYTMSAGNRQQQEWAASNKIVQLTDGSDQAGLEQNRALLTMTQLFDDAGKLPEKFLAIELQATVADALWEWNEDTARDMFETAIRSIGSMTETSSSTGRPNAAASKDPAALRQIVLRLLSRHDPNLAKRLLHSADKASGRKNLEENTDGMLALQFAQDVVETDPQKAAQLVQQSLSKGVTRDNMKLLLQLRLSAPALADQLFLYGLGAAEQDRVHFVDSLSWLARYILPETGPSMFDDDVSGHPGDPYQPDPELVSRFFDTAFRFFAARNDPTQMSPQRSRLAAMNNFSDYLSLRGLFALLQAYEPERTAALRSAARGLVNGDEHPGWRDPSDSSPDDLIKKADDEQDPKRKDILYSRAVMTAAQAGDFDQALRLIPKIADDQKRASNESTVRYRAALTALAKRDLESAYSYAKKISGIQQKVLIFGKLAVFARAEGDLPRALNTISEARQAIGKEPSGPAKVNALSSVANAAIQVDSSIGKQMVKDAVDAVNGLDATPEAGDLKGDQTLTANLLTGAKKTAPRPLDTASLTQAFSRLARNDFDEGLSLAQSVKKKDLSIQLQLSICRAALLERKSQGKPGA